MSNDFRSMQNDIYGDAGPRCLTCLAHPGWAHADESRRQEPRDVCRACHGSGVAQ